jgi:hypothetical protein
MFKLMFKAQKDLNSSIVEMWSSSPTAIHYDKRLTIPTYRIFKGAAIYPSMSMRVTVVANRDRLAQHQEYKTTPN